MSLESAIEFLLPDELFEEVMQGMVDSAWLRERAETIAAQGGPEANAKAAALFEAADAAAASVSPDAAP